LEDLARLTSDLVELNPDVIVGFGSGSTMDAIKPAEALRTLGGDIEEYFGTGLISQALAESGKSLTPFIAIQTVASSASHLTKYSNITNLETGQKKLIVDEAGVPTEALFDYQVTFSTPNDLTADGALDGVAHCLEVLYGAVGNPNYVQVAAIAQEGIRLAIQYLPRVLENPWDAEARRALGLATDLGGYAIMVGGTNGAHLNSFSFVDILSHGRACALMNPYYTVFFAPAIQEPLHLVGKILQDSGDLNADLDRLDEQGLGQAVAKGLIAFQRRIGFPTTLGEVPGFDNEHIERALTAAKNPQLKMKLENMPIALTADRVDEYMGSVLEAARVGDFSLIKQIV
jgi:alcohol dehydrogenase class IV